MTAGQRIERTPGILPLIARVFGLTRGHRRPLFFAVACGLAYTLLSLVPPLVVRAVIGALVNPSGDAVAIGELAAVLVIVALLRGLTRYGETFTSHVVAYRVLNDLIERVFAHVQRLPQRFFADRRSAEIATRAVVDATEIEVFIAHAVTQATQAMLVPTAMIAILVALNWQLALVALAPLPIAVWLSVAFLPPMQRRWRRVRARLSELSATVQESLAGITVVKAFGAEASRQALVERQSRGFRDEIVAANRNTLIPTSALEALAGVAAALVIWQGASRALGGEIAAADLLVFVFYLGQIYLPLLQLAALGESVNTAIASADRVFSLLDAEPDMLDRPDTPAPRVNAWSVEFRDVTFGYDPDRPVLRDVSFLVAAGETVALVGMTGAGKSTTASLVPRLYDPWNGSVRLGDHDVRDLPLAFARRQVAMVLQDVFLFEGSVRENLLVARPNATEVQIEAAARAANADGFIRDLPGGYEARVGERGVRLSGGQKQRISIARALLRDAPILVLDEATSSVDAETEGLIQEALERLARGRTTIVIAHRLSTIRNADRIVVLDDGRVAEIGTHDDLIARDGLYAAMYRAHAASRGWTVRSAAGVPGE
ncbi:MAG: ABC transporter ATP-binding protein [Chloroflexota bacterium]|nr:MAG: ABC transporter ATP-binding protein [Chloroflexota bacterium]